MNLICFSHLRWNFVYQRPQHLMTRFAKKYDVYFIEEPLYIDEKDGYTIYYTDENVRVITPHMQQNAQGDETERIQKILCNIFRMHEIKQDIFWYYTPMALKYTYNLTPKINIYDCMDELSAFKFAPAELQAYESMLFKRADIVFTGGYNLYSAKKHLHSNIYPFPSSIDKTHFAQARKNLAEMPDQKNIPHPRFGFFGVLDERFDISLIKRAAAMKPEWSFIFIGPIVKIHPDSLPQNDNIYYLGPKKYEELPSYISKWDVAMLPFAINESTKYISPTKTPEYLAAGKPVISTPIADVVTPYGSEGLVHIINNATEFVETAEKILTNTKPKEWLCRVDSFLNPLSWNTTWYDINAIIEKELKKHTVQVNSQTEVYV